MQKQLTLDDKTNRNVSGETRGSRKAMLGALQVTLDL